MKELFQQFLGLIFIVLIVANVIFFLNGMHLSNEINKFESQIQLLKKSNADLEKKAYQTESLLYAASMAAKLQFTKKSAPIYLKMYGKN